MNIGTFTGLILFDASVIDLVYVATAPGGNTVELFNYKLGFYRLPYKNIHEIFHATKVYRQEITIWIVVGVIFAIFFSLVCIYQTMHKKKTE